MSARSRGGAPGGLGAGDLLRLQRTAGNRAVAELAGSAPREASPDGDRVFDAALIGEANPRVTALRRRLDRALDRVPRPVVTLGVGRLVVEQPAFRAWIWAGVGVAVAAVLALGPAAGLGRAQAAAVAAGAVGLMGAVVLVHRLISYGMQASVLTGALLAALLVGAEPLAALDVAAVALALAQLLGRVGCARVGCCHGRPSRWGHRYGPAHVRFGFPVRLVGVRLLPVQLAEAAWCAVLAVAGAWLVLRGAPPGSAFLTHAVGYGAGRFGFELLRGDAERRWWGGLSQAQWTAAAIAAGTLALMALGALPRLWLHAAAAAALLVVAARRSARWRRGPTWIERLDHVRGWDDLALGLYRMEARAGRRSEPEATLPVTHTSLGLRVSRDRRTTPAGPHVTYGVSHEARVLEPAEAARVAEWLLELRHPDRTGVLLRPASGPDVLVVPPREAAEETAIDPPSPERIP